VRLTAITELKHLGTRTSYRKLAELARTDRDADVRDAALRAMTRSEGPGGAGAEGGR
jgi:hypothetical protein